MDKVNKIGNAAIKKLSNKKPNKRASSGGQSLEELVKQATAKTLSRPDPDLNQQVVDLIGSAVHSDGPHAVAKVLTDRLEQKNQHKVWLAVMLIREVLGKSMKELGPAREAIMGEVQKVASSPIDRFDKNLQDQQSTKHAAFELLKIYGHDGHILSQPHLEQEAASRRAQKEKASVKQGEHGQDRGTGERRTLPDLLEHCETQIAMADSHNELLQELLLDTSQFQQKSPQDQLLAKDVLLNATKFGQQFEKSINHLGAFDTPEAQSMMSTALEKMDILNNSLNLHKELIKQQAEQIAGKPFGEIKSSTSPARKDEKPAQSPVANLIELQDSLDAYQPVSQGSQGAHSTIHDPFAASTNWQQPQQHQEQGPRQGLGQQQAYSQAGQTSSHYQPMPGTNPFISGPSFNQPGSGPQANYAGPHNFGNTGGYGPPQAPNHGQPYGQQPGPAYGQQQNPGYAQQYYPQGPHQWGGQLGHQSHPHFGVAPPPPYQPQQFGNQAPGSFSQPFGAPARGFNGQAPPHGFGQKAALQHQPSLHSQGSVRSQSGANVSKENSKQASPRHAVPMLRAEIVLPPQASPEQRAAPADVDRVAAATPLTGARSKPDSFESSAFGGKSDQSSPVPPKTPASQQPVNARTSDVSPPSSAEKPALSSQPLRSPVEFEPSALGTQSKETPVQGSQSSRAQPVSQQQPAVSVPAGQSAVVKPQGQSEATHQASQPDDWDLFFNERSGQVQNKASATGPTTGSNQPTDLLAEAFGDMALPKK